MIGNLGKMKRICNNHTQISDGSIIVCKFSIKDIIDLCKKYNIYVHKAINIYSKSCNVSYNNNYVGAIYTSSCILKGSTYTVVSGYTSCNNPSIVVNNNPCTGKYSSTPLCVTIT